MTYLLTADRDHGSSGPQAAHYIAGGSGMIGGKMKKHIVLLSAVLIMIAVMSANALPITTDTSTGDIIDPTALHVLDSDSDPVILGHAISSCPEIILRPGLTGQMKILVLVAQLLNRPQCRYFQSGFYSAGRGEA